MAQMAKPAELMIMAGDNRNAKEALTAGNVVKKWRQF